MNLLGHALQRTTSGHRAAPAALATPWDRLDGWNNPYPLIGLISFLATIPLLIPGQTDHMESLLTAVAMPVILIVASMAASMKRHMEEEEFKAQAEIAFLPTAIQSTEEVHR